MPTSRATTLSAGTRAPAFALQADDGSTVRLSALRGRTVVLYFYPKDDTPGCTTEACEFRDHTKRLEARGAVVLGVSPDTVAAHQRFRDKYDLDFRLLADTDHKVAAAYGVWQRKSMYGRTYWGVVRTTFVIDERGRIARVFERVKPAGHAAAVLEALASE